MSSIYNTARKLSLTSSHLPTHHHLNLASNGTSTHTSSSLVFCGNQLESSNELGNSSNSVRKVQIIKSVYNPPDAGITLCGGIEAGLKGTIYISRIAKGSLAEKNNLKIGDQILSVNYTSFLDPNITCQKASHIICLQDCLNLNILPRREALSSQRIHHTYSWIDLNGRPVSPPPSDSDILEPTEGDNFTPTGSSSLFSPRLSHTSKPTDQGIRIVKMTMKKGVSPGLMIRGGLEYGLGIYVTRVDKNSLAERAGLKVGDRILSVNNTDFRNLIHDEAVAILGSSPILTMKVKYVGKVPASPASFIKDIEQTEESENMFNSSVTSNPSSSLSGYSNSKRASTSHCSRSESLRMSRRPCNTTRRVSVNSTSSIMISDQDKKSQSVEVVKPTLLVTEVCHDHLLEEKLQAYLSESERMTFAYYRNEYDTKAMTVDAFFSLLLELLNTREKYLILNHIRSVIRAEDIDKFDELIFKREEHAMLKNNVNNQDSSRYISSNEDLSEGSVCFGQKSTLTEAVENDDNDECIANEDESLNMSFVSIKRNLTRTDACRSLFEQHFSPYRDQFSKSIARRHSNCHPQSSSLISHSDANHLIVSNPSEKRWSIAVTHELPTNPNFDYLNQHLNERSASNGGEMKSLITKDLRASNNQIQMIIKNDASFISSPDSSQFNPNHSGVRRHRSLPIPSLTKFPMPNRTLHYQPLRTSSFRIPQRRAVQEPDGKLRVTVKKSRPILGIAIEGGCDVNNQPQPRIISIHSSGSAFDTGDLHVGHIILEVDGIATNNYRHDEIAQVIADAYYNTPHKDYIEFLVRKKSKHEFDMRKSSFMLVNNSFE